MKDNLRPGESLELGVYLQSRNGKYFFGIWPTCGESICAVPVRPPRLGSSGVLGVFGGTPDNPLGVSIILAHGVSKVTMQYDGNLCANNPSGNAWCAMTQGEPNCAIMQDDGNFCLYAGSDASNPGAFKWGSVQQGSNTQSFAAMPLTPAFTTVTIDARTRCDWSVQWNGGQTDYYPITSTVVWLHLLGPRGVSCWLRARNWARHHDSGDNFTMGDPDVMYTLSSTMFNFSWNRTR